jgi:hypothetical protein
MCVITPSDGFLGEKIVLDPSRLGLAYKLFLEGDFGQVCLARVTPPTFFLERVSIRD